MRWKRSRILITAVAAADWDRYGGLLERAVDSHAMS